MIDMDSKITRLIEQASVIVGALPYLQAYRDKTFLIKFGGSAMDDARLVKKLMRDIVLLEVLGFNPVIVHGGGKAISKAMAEAGLEARFINGLRVTTPEAISIVERTLSGTINPGLVQMFRDYGGKGVGIPGTEIFVGERIQEKDEQGNPVDIGEVGNVIGCLTDRITEALELQITPIVSPLAKELGTHKPLNVNADLAAAALAKELKPVKLIYISDVPGIMKDPADPSTLIKSVTRTEALDLIEDGTVSGGMIPKIHSAIDALNAGVRKVHFIDGRLPHTLLLEIFTRTASVRKSSGNSADHPPPCAFSSFFRPSHWRRPPAPCSPLRPAFPAPGPSPSPDSRGTCRECSSCRTAGRDPSTCARFSTGAGNWTASA